MNTCIYLYIYAYMHTYIHAYTWAHFHAQLCVYVYIYIYMYIYTHIHTHGHIPMHNCACSTDTCQSSADQLKQIAFKLGPWPKNGKRKIVLIFFIRCFFVPNADI